MKTKFLSLLALTFLLFSVNMTSAFAEEPVVIDASNFPDTAFSAYILEHVDTDKDGCLSENEISATTSLNVSGKSIRSLKGIEHFTNLPFLQCGNNLLVELDISALPEIVSVSCPSGNIPVVLTQQNQFTLPFTDPDFAGKISSLEGATLQGTTFTAQSESISYRYDIGNGLSILVSLKTTTPLYKDIANAEFAAIPDMTYTGKACTPAVSITLNGTALDKSCYTVSYQNNVEPGKAQVTITGQNQFYGTKTAGFSILPKKVTSLKATSKKATSIKLKWKKVPSVTGYEIYRYQTSTKKYKKIKSVGAKKASYTIKKLSPATDYRFKIKAVKKVNGSTYKSAFSKVLKVTTALSAPKLTLNSRRNGQVNLLWNTVKNADGVVISYKVPGGKYQTLATLTNADGTSAHLYMLQAGTRYTFRLRAYRTNGNKKIYSKYVTKSVTVSGAGAPPVTGDYNVGGVYGPALNQTELAQVREQVQYFVDHCIDDTMSDYEKVKMAHDYLVSICSYAPDWSQNRANTAWGALIYHEAQCSGYARAMKALCDGMGIACYYVHADATASIPSHQWNVVAVDGQWYIVDVQCNDSSGFYAAFLVSDATYIGMSGLSWDRSSIPACPKDY